MSQEVYEMITRLDRERIETHLVVQCAPMISGMKVSNLLNVEKKLAPQMKQVLERSGISYYLLLESEDKATFLVYREDGLKAYLMQDRVCQSMKSFGYESLDLSDVLSRFQTVWSRLQNFHMRWDYCSVILWKMWRDSLRTKVTIICMPVTGKCTDM